MYIIFIIIIILLEKTFENFIFLESWLVNLQKILKPQIPKFLPVKELSLV